VFFPRNGTRHGPSSDFLKPRRVGDEFVYEFAPLKDVIVGEFFPRRSEGGFAPEPRPVLAAVGFCKLPDANGEQFAPVRGNQLRGA
jgi:hypothetical protein